jgi:DNA-binding CsgD family transcriptional regulator
MIRQNTELASLLATAISLVHQPLNGAAETVQIGNSRFRLIAEHHEGAGWIVVLMQVGADDCICDEQLKVCYGLTNREIQVARLLADRRSNREIADMLDITVYTAGRHTERVLRKLGVASRRDVRSKLTGSDTG